MIYILKGHNLKHATEEIILHMLPTAITKHACEIPQDEQDYCVSDVYIDGDFAKATATVRINNKVRIGFRESFILNLDELAKKRSLTEIIKLSIYDAILPFLDKKPEWGSLTGVRPAKLARGLMKKGMTKEQTVETFCNKFGVSKERTEITIKATEYAQLVEKMLTQKTFSLYVGIPFCPSKCSYCSFVSQSVENSSHLISPYVDAICEEIEQTAKIFKDFVLSSVYIGGGTPTTLSTVYIEKIMKCIRNSFDMSSVDEYTVEAGRPDTITKEKMFVIKQNGANRVSINPQTMNDDILKNIGRNHSAKDVINAYNLTRAVGFEIINMDIIAGLYGETVQSFNQTINQIINLNPENITVHTLAVKRGADLYDKTVALKLYDTVKQMLYYSNEKLLKKGYNPYYIYRQKFTAGGFENVGWCKLNTQSIYNISMMEELQSIVSVGAGAVSKYVECETGKIIRFANPKYPKEYIEAGERIIIGKQNIFSNFRM